MQRCVRLILDVVPKSDLYAKVSWNGEVVYHDLIIGNTEWYTKADLWGDIDLAVSIAGRGSVIWRDLHMNYTGCLLCLPGSESSGGQRVLPRDFFAPPSVSPDCRRCVSVDGQLVEIDRSSGLTGNWHYELIGPCEMRASIRIDRQKTMLWTPVI
jgi:hypothetical protein